MLLFTSGRVIERLFLQWTTNNTKAQAGNEQADSRVAKEASEYQRQKGFSRLFVNRMKSGPSEPKTSGTFCCEMNRKYWKMRTMGYGSRIVNKSQETLVLCHSG